MLRPTSPWPWLVVAFLALGASIARQPARGLTATRFADEAFTQPVGEPFLFEQTWFSSAQPFRPRPDWLADRSGVRLEGFLEVIRPGEANFDLGSDDGARLFIDGKLVVDDWGTHAFRRRSTRIPLEKGWTPIRIEYWQAGGDAILDLAWMTPGGVGAASGLPSVLLSPVAREPMGWGDRLLRWLVLLAFATAFVAAFGGRILQWFRALTEDVGAWGRVTLLAVVALAFGVRLVGLNDAGETCDEATYTLAGREYVLNLMHGVFDPDQWKANREHPAVGKLLYGFAQYFFGDVPTSSRVLSSLLSTATVAITGWIALVLSTPAVALVAMVVLALHPSFVAHGRIGALDTPATFFFTLAAALLVAGLADPARRNRRFAWMSLVISLAIATKFSTGLVVGLVYAALFVGFWPRIRREGRLDVPLSIYLLPATMLLLVPALWPWLWWDPRGHLNETLGHWGYNPTEFFLGKWQAPPPRYFFAFAFAAVTPALLWPGFLSGLVAAFRPSSPLVRTTEGSDVSALALRWVLVGWFLVPFAWSFSHMRQDGIRYVHAAFPPFALLVGLGFEQLRGFVADRLPFAHIRSVVAVLVVYLAGLNAWVQPFQLDFFSELLGGPSTVYRRGWFEVGWWGEGQEAAAAWLNENAPPNATWGHKGSVDHTVVGLRKDLRRVKVKPDFWVRSGLDQAPGREPIEGYDVVRKWSVGDAPIVWIYRRKAPGTPLQPESSPEPPRP